MALQSRVGQHVADASRPRHDTVVAFFHAIGVSPKQAEIDANGIQHAVSQESLTAMKRTLRG